ncbi:MAG: FAD-binding protein [Elusimicrobia bacterium]|nr:FAD-binding protein [Elusimicrobiota bacterium]
MNTHFVKRLQKEIGKGNVLDSPASLLIYSYDSGVDKALPGAVVLPQTASQVAAVVGLARREGIPFVARGAGTNLCGCTIPVPGGLVIHLSRMDRVLKVDAHRRRAVVEPGVVNLRLQKVLVPYGLTYAPDPASQKACTLGGNAGTNAGGPHCLKHGITTHHVTGCEVVLPDGTFLRTSIDDPGYDLTGLFVGAEGTLGIITQIEVGLLPLPEDVRTFLVSYPSIEAAVQSVTDIISSGIVPTALELMDRVTVEAVEEFVHAGYPRGVEAVLLIEVDGPKERIRRESEKLRELCQKNGGGDIREAQNEREREKLWEGRRGSYPAMARLAPNVLVEDGVVPRTRLPEAVKRIRAIAAREGIRMGLIAHAGDGNLHPNMIFDERNPEETRLVRAAGYEMMKVCVELGGSISGEHGIGIDKREAMRWLFTPQTLTVFRKIKTAFDPDNLCNPDKLIPVAEQPGRGLDHGSLAVPVAAPSQSSGTLEAPEARGAPSQSSGTLEAPEARNELPDSGVLPIQNVEHLQRVLRGARAAGRAVFLKGLGTKGFPIPSGALILALDGLKSVVDYDKENFTLSVQCGWTLPELGALIGPHSQFLHIDGGGTLGGILSARASLKPRLRDQVIGMKCVLSDGQLVEFGAKVMKNVAGYDAAKLFLGAWGSLGVITEVTLRLFPFPPEEPFVKNPRPETSRGEDPRRAIYQKIKNIFDPAGIMNPTIKWEEPTVAR